MKKLKTLFVAFMLMAALAVCTSAAVTANYGIEKATISGATGDFYKLVVTLDDTTGTFRAYKTTITFDTSVVIPVSKTKGTAINLDGTTVKTPLQPAQYYDEDNEENVDVSYTPGYPKWSLSGTTGKLEFESYSTVFFAIGDMPVMQMYFKFADGKSAKDITDSVFSMDYIEYGNGQAFYYGHATKETNITYVNNVVYKSTALTISVTAGDVVYTQDGKVTTATATGDFEIPSTDGYVTVNTGYAAQKLYKVASGAVTEVADNANGVLGTNDASVRSDSVATGLRFKSSFLTALQNSVKEYGYLVTVESEANALSTGYVLNMALVDSGKAKKGVAFAKDDAGNVTTNISFDAIDARTIVTAVATGIPETKAGVNTYIVARPYYVLDGGTVVYGETSRRTIGGVALSIQNTGGEVYTQNKAYVDKIVGLIDDKNAVIDMGNLFAE